MSAHFAEMYKEYKAHFKQTNIRHRGLIGAVLTLSPSLGRVGEGLTGGLSGASIYVLSERADIMNYVPTSAGCCF